MIGRMEVMTMPPVVTPDQRQGREFAKREIVRYVEHGMTEVPHFCGIVKA